MEEITGNGVAAGLSPPWFEALLHQVAFAAELLGVAAIVAGGLLAIWRAARHWLDPGLRDRTYHTFAAELLGVAAIVAGGLLAIWRAARHWLDPGLRDRTYHTFRLTLARGILLGLEFLVAADIIGTVAFEPTLQNLSVLAVIVAIRTFLSFSLTMEIEGRLPWRDDQPPR